MSGRALAGIAVRLAMEDIDLSSLEPAEPRLLTQQAGRNAFELEYAGVYCPGCSTKSEEPTPHSFGPLLIVVPLAFSNPTPTPNTIARTVFTAPWHSLKLPTTLSNSLKIRCLHHS